jgi:hypothetical protein
MRGQSLVAIDFTYLGSTEAAEDLVAPLRALGTPVLDTTGTVPVDQIGTVTMEPDDPTPAVEGSTLLHTFVRGHQDSRPGGLRPRPRRSDAPTVRETLRRSGKAATRPADFVSGFTTKGPPIM